MRGRLGDFSPQKQRAIDDASLALTCGKADGLATFDEEVAALTIRRVGENSKMDSGETAHSPRPSNASSEPWRIILLEDTEIVPQKSFLW